MAETNESFNTTPRNSQSVLDTQRDDKLINEKVQKVGNILYKLALEEVEVEHIFIDTKTENQNGEQLSEENVAETISQSNSAMSEIDTPNEWIDVSKEPKQELEEIQSDVSLVNLELAEILQIADVCPTTNASEIPMSTTLSGNVILVLVNISQQNELQTSLKMKQGTAANETLPISGDMPKSMENNKSNPVAESARLTNCNQYSQTSPKNSPAKNEWVLYRPRTRSAKKRISAVNTIVLSSDSDDNDRTKTSVHEHFLKEEHIEDRSLIPPIEKGSIAATVVPEDSLNGNVDVSVMTTDQHSTDPISSNDPTLTYNQVEGDISPSFKDTQIQKETLANTFADDASYFKDNYGIDPTEVDIETSSRENLESVEWVSSAKGTGNNECNKMLDDDVEETLLGDDVKQILLNDGVKATLLCDDVKETLFGNDVKETLLGDDVEESQKTTTLSSVTSKLFNDKEMDFCETSFGNDVQETQKQEIVSSKLSKTIDKGMDYREIDSVEDSIQFIYSSDDNENCNEAVNTIPVEEHIIDGTKKDIDRSHMQDCLIVLSGNEEPSFIAETMSTRHSIADSQFQVSNVENETKHLRLPDCKPSCIKRSMSDDVIKSKKYGSEYLTKLYSDAVFNLKKLINEKVDNNDEPKLAVTAEVMNVEERIVTDKTPIEDSKSDVNVSSDRDKKLTCTVVDSASKEGQALLHVVVTEHKLQKLIKKTGGPMPKLTENSNEEDDTVTAEQLQRSNDKWSTMMNINDDEYDISMKDGTKEQASSSVLTEKNDQHPTTKKPIHSTFSLNIRQAGPKNIKSNKNPFDLFQSDDDLEIVASKKRKWLQTSKTSKVIVPEKKLKYTSKQEIAPKTDGFLKRSISKISTKWCEQRKKIKSKFLPKKSLSSKQKWTTLETTSAGAFTVTDFPKEEICESVSGFMVIPTYHSFHSNLM